MNKSILIILVIFSTKFLFGQLDIIGNYDNNSRKHSKLKLNTDSTFMQFNTDCTYKLETKGTWKVSGDTILLAQNKIYSLSQKNKKLEVSPGTINYNTALRMNKYLIKPDALILLHSDFKEWTWLKKINKK